MVGRTGNRQAPANANSGASNTHPEEMGYVSLGIPFALDEWAEDKKAAKLMFLTAVAPSNAEFSVYTKHNSNNFSFFDSMNGVDTAQVSYHVTGWYSGPEKDILNQRETDEDPKQHCMRLGWLLDETGELTDARKGVSNNVAFYPIYIRSRQPDGLIP